MGSLRDGVILLPRPECILVSGLGRKKRHHANDGRKGSVTYCLGANLFLPHYPSVPTGVWTLARKSNLGEHRSVRRCGTASKVAVVRLCCMRMRGFSRIEVFTIFLKNIRVNKVQQIPNALKCIYSCQRLSYSILFYFYFSFYNIKLMFLVKKESLLVRNWYG